MKKYQAKFSDKVVVVAGGTSGMGEQVVRQLAPFARTVVVLGRNELAGERLEDDFGERVVFRRIEMKDERTLKRLLKDINKQHGPIDYFFNFAGTFLAGEIRDTPVPDWHAIYDNNILPIVHGTSAIYEIMRDNGHGAIINVASAAGLFPVPIMNIYGSTKSAVVSLTLGLRMEAKAFNIAVSVACPTIVKTPLYDTAMYDGVKKKRALDLLKGRIQPQTADEAARRILIGTAKGKSIIHTSSSTRFGWAVFRLSPALYLWAMQRVFKLYRSSLREN